MSDLSLFVAGPFNIDDADAVCSIRSYALPPVRKLISSAAAVYMLLQSGRLLRIERSASGAVLLRPVSLLGERCEDIACAGNSCLAVTSAAKPAAAKQLPKLTPDKSTSASSGTVAIATRVLAWGDNSMGQLGLACTARPIVEPTAVIGLSRLGVKSIFAGSTYSAAILQNGSVAFWGDLDGTPGAVPNVIVIPSRVFGCVASAAAQGGSGGNIPGFPVSIALGAASFVVLNAEGTLYEVALPPPEHMHVDTACAPGSSFPYVLQADTGTSTAPVAASRDAVCIRFLSGGMLAGARVQAIAAGNGCFYALTGANAVAAWGERVHREWLTGQWAPRPVALLTPEEAQSLQRSLFGQSGGDTGRGGGSGTDAASARVIAWANRWVRLAVMPPARREEEVRALEASLVDAPLPAFARGYASAAGAGEGGISGISAGGSSAGGGGIRASAAGAAEDPGVATADAPTASAASSAAAAASTGAAAGSAAAAKAAASETSLYQPLGLAGGADAGGLWRSRSLCWAFAMQQLGPDALSEVDLAKLARIARGKPLRGISSVSEGEDVAAPAAAAGAGGAGGGAGQLGRAESSAVDGEESEARFVRRGLTTLALLAAPDALPQWRASHTAMFFDFPTSHCLVPALGITREGRIAVVDGFVRPLRVHTYAGRVLRGSSTLQAAASGNGPSATLSLSADVAAHAEASELHTDSSDDEDGSGDSCADAAGDTMLLHNALSAFWATDVAQSRHFVVWLGRYDPSMHRNIILASATVTAGRYDLKSERLRHVPRSLTLTITPPDIITGERGEPPVRMRGTWQGFALPHSLAVTAPAAGLSDELAARLALRMERAWRKQLAPWFGGPDSWRSHAHGRGSSGVTPRYVSAALAVRNMLSLITTAGSRVGSCDVDSLAAGSTDSAPSDEQQYPEPRALDQSAFLLAPLPLVHPPAVALGSGGAGAIAAPWPCQRIEQAGRSAAGAAAAAMSSHSDSVASAQTLSGTLSPFASAGAGAGILSPAAVEVAQVASSDPAPLPGLPLLPGSPSSTSSALAAAPSVLLTPASAASVASRSVSAAWTVVPAMSSAAAAAAVGASALRDPDAGLERCMRILHQAALLFSESRRRAAIATRRQALIARRQANAALKTAEAQLKDARAAAQEAVAVSKETSLAASAEAQSPDAEAAASAASASKARASRSPSPAAESASASAAADESVSGPENPVLAALLSSSSATVIKKKDRRRGGEKGSMKGGMAFGKSREEAPPTLASPRGNAVAESAATAALASAAQLATVGRAGAGSIAGSDAESAAVNRILADLQSAEDAAATGGTGGAAGASGDEEDGTAALPEAPAGAALAGAAAVVEYAFEPLLVDVPPGAVFHSTGAATRSARYAAAARAALAGESSSMMLRSGSEAGSDACVPTALDDDDDDGDDDGADDGRSVYTAVTGTAAGDTAGSGAGRTAAGSGHAHVTLIAPTNWWERSARFAALCDFAYGEGWRVATVAAVSRHVLAQYARYAGLSGLRGEAFIASWFSDPLPSPTAAAGTAPATVYDDTAQASVSVSATASLPRPSMPVASSYSTGSAVDAGSSPHAPPSGAGQGFAAALAAATPAAIQSLLTPKVVSKATRARARARACADGMLLALRFAWARRSVFASAVNTVAPDLVLASPASGSAPVPTSAATTAAAATSFVADEARSVVELGCVHAHVLARRIPARFGWLAAAGSGGGRAAQEPELQPFGTLASEASSALLGAGALASSLAAGSSSFSGGGSAGSPSGGGAGWRELATRTVEVCEELVQPLTLAHAITGIEAARDLAAPPPLASATSSTAALLAGGASDASDAAAADVRSIDAAAEAIAAAEAAVTSAVRTEARATAAVQALWPSAPSLAAVAEAGGKGSVGDLLQYLYAGRVDLRLDNAQTILEAADALLLRDARAAAEEFLCSSCIHEGSVRGLLELALHRNAPRLASCCAIYANRWSLQMPPHLAWSEPNPAAFAASLAPPVGPTGSSVAGSSSSSAAGLTSPHGIARAGFSSAAAAVGGAGGGGLCSASGRVAGAASAAAAAEVPGKSSSRAASDEAASEAAALAAVFRRRRLEADNPSHGIEGDDEDVREPDHHHGDDDADPGDASDAHAAVKAPGPAVAAVAAAAVSSAPTSYASASSASTATAALAWGKKVWGKPAAAAAAAVGAPSAAAAGASIAAVTNSSVASAAAPPFAWGSGARVAASSLATAPASANLAAAAVPLAASLVGAVDATAFPSLGVAAAAPATAALRRSRSTGGDSEGVRLYAGAGGAVEDYHGHHDDSGDFYGAAADVSRGHAAAAAADDYDDHPVDVDEGLAAQPNVAADGDDGDDNDDDDDDVRHVPVAAAAATAHVHHHDGAAADDPSGEAEAHPAGHDV